jgi:hypothetical protein
MGSGSKGIAMAVAGEWTLFYDWGCDGGYGSSSMTVNTDGTWSNGEGFRGRWAEGAGMFMFKFDGIDTTYAGNHASQSITGISSTFDGLDGCFYMLQKGVPVTFTEGRARGKADSAGGS